jgi:hypothetical protein
MFENAQFFSHLHFKIAKSAIMTLSKTRRILCWFQIRWCRLKQMPLKKARAKNYANFEFFNFCAFFRGFLLLTFVRGISESRHQWIWILLVFDTHIDIFQEFLGHNSTFCNLKMQMRKNYTFSNILQKVKSYFFPNIYDSPFDSH